MNSESLPMGPVMLDVAGTFLSDLERRRIAHPNTGGVILFSRNYESPGQLQALVAEIRAARPGKILIAVDQEGGRVQRFRLGFTRLPAARAYEAQYRGDPALALTVTASAGWLMASELLAVGVDFSFAPVLDVDQGISQVIGDRSFAADSGAALALARAFRRGMRRAGMAAVGKHFPGHGAVALDSHLSLPVDERDFEALNGQDLVPFRGLIDEGLEGIMPAHVVYPRLDDQPAGFSHFWIQTVLRERLGFSGAVFSDDLSMEGAAGAGSVTERTRRALGAGCDMVLICNQPEEADKVLDSLEAASCSIREQRLSAMAGCFRRDWAGLQNNEEWQTARRTVEALVENQ